MPAFRTPVAIRVILAAPVIGYAAEPAFHVPPKDAACR
jgi:hypothetical protein